MKRNFNSNWVLLFETYDIKYTDNNETVTFNN